MNEERPGPVSSRRPRVVTRMGTWLAWWVLLMAFWIMIDDSLAADELLAGAGAAAIAALAAEIVSYQAAVRFRVRPRWLLPALRLPGQVVSDTVILCQVLWQRVITGKQPDSGFVTRPARFGDGSPEGMTRRLLLIGGRSLAPNAFVVDIDAETDTMVLHELVQRERGDRP
jgi:multisubunit Na+/H+ antiporter MnhE subunit